MLKLTLTILLILSTNAHAQLSANPWLNANNDEDIEEVYQKRSRRGRESLMNEQYTAEESTVVDRTHAYLQDDEQADEEENTGFMDKLSNLVSPKQKNDDTLIPNTADNRRKRAEQKQQAAQETKQESTSSILPNLGLGELGNSLKLPSFNTINMIQKFEKASGINLKAIGKKFK